MAKYLFIIESPGKLKKIASFLNSSFQVIATKGHIMDLPPKKIGVDIKNDFKTTYEVYPEKKDTVKKIKEAAKKAEMVYLATDEDREGWQISQEIIDILPTGTPYKRVTYNAVTKKDILEGIENAGEMNNNLVQSAETRRVLDRIVGWRVSFPTRQATGGSSAGRVQSAALRILAEREKEIKNFIPQEYWPIEIELEKENGERVVATIKIPKPLEINTEKKAQDICDKLKKGSWAVSNYETKEKSTRAYPPFTTSTLYQSGSSILGWGSEKTAKTAQYLYENSFISYIRSDSTYIVPDFINSIRTKIPDKYGNDYLSSKTNYFQNKKNAQEAHEAIRVIDINNENVSDGDYRKLYAIIYKRTLASQMADLLQLMTSVEFKCDKYIFGANGNKILFEGFRKCWNYGSLDDNIIPEFKVGEKVKCINVKTEQKFTVPPSHYSESSLIKELEKRGIGRPSTYATICSTLLNRKYIEKNKNILSATDMGIRVSDFLVESDFCFVNLDFTAQMEEDLDCIASGDCNKLDILNEFWKRLKSDLTNATKVKDEKSITEYECKNCGEKLLLKYSKFGVFYACSGCKSIYNLGEDKEPIEKEKKKIEKSSFKCPNCGKKLIKRVSKKNWEYLSCENWSKDKKCSGFFDKDSGEKIEFKKKKKWGKKKGNGNDD